MRRHIADDASSRRAIFWASFAAVFVYVASAVWGQGTPVPSATPERRTQQKIELRVDEVGDARATVVTRFDKLPKRLRNADLFTARNAAAWWAREAGLGEHWFKLDDVTLKPDLERGEFTTQFVIHGFARRTSKGWEFRALDDPDRIHFDGSSIDYTVPTQTALGVVERSVAITVPGNAQVKVNPNTFVTTYELPDPAPRDAVRRHTANLELDSAPQLMACLAKCYGYEKFPALWVGRTRFTNTGDGAIGNYRVRFRLTEYSTDWTPWARTQVVLPGQTVVDPYFPVLDVEKIAKIEGTRQCTMEIEYEYTLASGQVVKDTDGRKVELAGRNVRLYDSGDDQAPFDLDVHAPMLCAAFVSKDDPVIQMAAGRICGQVKGGLAPSIKPEDAIRFLEQTQRFLVHNKVTYQTPPASQLMQHHKYGREVLQNRAGTCVDLANFYASVAEAVGLEVTLLLPPGHCFMMVKLPPVTLPARFKLDGKDVELKDLPEDQVQKLIEMMRKDLLTKHRYLYRDGNSLYCPMECTKIRPDDTFAKSAAYALAELTNPDDRPTWVKISVLRARGIHPLELPEVPANVLEQWGITPADETGPGGGAVDLAGGPKRLVGDWRNEFVFNGQQYRVDSTFSADGTMTATILDARGATLATGGGQWKLDDKGNYTLTGVVNEQATISWTDEDTFIYKVVRSTNPAAQVGAEAINRRRK